MVDVLEHARDAFRRHAWEDAYARLSAVDKDGALAAPEDLDRLARAA